MLLKETQRKLVAYWCASCGPRVYGNGRSNILTPYTRDTRTRTNKYSTSCASPSVAFIAFLLIPCLQDTHPPSCAFSSAGVRNKELAAAISQ
ncbi:hypothetical protein E2C01_086433 [Portunus trituberculatus]|uniref:Uncharacterized protein n=1 Tax=Portunus trituberculatus TaxID=210409 RepID=A0A5B7JEK5_PORTR|nr:hypothetical protein [Portunus trituberculatus]